MLDIPHLWKLRLRYWQTSQSCCYLNLENEWHAIMILNQYGTKIKRKKRISERNKCVKILLCSKTSTVQFMMHPFILPSGVRDMCNTQPFPSLPWRDPVASLLHGSSRKATCLVLRSRELLDPLVGNSDIPFMEGNSCVCYIDRWCHKSSYISWYIYYTKTEPHIIPLVGPVLINSVYHCAQGNMETKQTSCMKVCIDLYRKGLLTVSRGKTPSVERHGTHSFISHHAWGEKQAWVCTAQGNDWASCLGIQKKQKSFSLVPECLRAQHKQRYWSLHSSKSFAYSCYQVLFVHFVSSTWHKGK